MLFLAKFDFSNVYKFVGKSYYLVKLTNN